MSQSEENMFENQWRKAFDDAAETPPSRVWDAIERQLDEDERGAAVIPLWSRVRPFAYGAAAAVALLLLGWWAFYYTDQPGGGQDTRMARREKMAAPQPDSQADRIARAEARQTGAARPEAQGPVEPTRTLSARKDGALAAVSRTPRKNPASHVPATGVYRTRPLETTADQMGNDEIARSNVRLKTTDGNPALTFSRTETEQLSNATPGESSGERLSGSTGARAEEMTAERLAGTYELMNGKPFSLRTRSGITRIVWFRMPDNMAAPKIDGKDRSSEYWTAVAVMPMSFNPSASVRVAGLSPAYTAAPSMLNTQKTSEAPTIQNRAKLSMAFQLGTGFKVSDHWSVETGVHYLQGNATAESNAVILTAMSSSANNLLESAVRNSAYADKASGNSFYANSSSSSTVVNDFRFIQVPLQAGYHIRPDAKVSFALLGGVLANVFLQNTVGTIEIKAADDIYRPVTLSGTAGLRFSYRPTRHWSGSLTGSYQQALQAGTRPEAQVQTRPQALGVGFGMNYHF